MIEERKVTVAVDMFSRRRGRMSEVAYQLARGAVKAATEDGARFLEVIDVTPVDDAHRTVTVLVETANAGR